MIDDIAKMYSDQTVNTAAAAGKARRQYATPTVLDYGPLHRVTHGGPTAVEDDVFGAGMMMLKTGIG